MHFCFLQSSKKSQNEGNVSAMFQPELDYLHIFFKFINYKLVMASFNIELSSKPVSTTINHPYTIVLYCLTYLIKSFYYFYILTFKIR